MPVATKSKPAKKPAGKKPNGDLKEGSTRMRMFKALYRDGAHGDGLTVSEIKDKTGMKPNSGHLFVLITEEIETKRVVQSQRDEKDESTVNTYKLTAAGRKAYETGDIDKRKSGGLIGKAWSKKRVAAEKKLKR